MFATRWQRIDHEISTYDGLIELGERERRWKIYKWKDLQSPLSIALPLPLWRSRLTPWVQDSSSAVSVYSLYKSKRLAMVIFPAVCMSPSSLLVWPP